MTMAVYRLPDEPMPSGLARYAVDPMWPLLAVMFAGQAVGFGWFVLNGIALGTPRRLREWRPIALAMLGAIALLAAIAHAARQGLLEGIEVRYALLSITALKLTCAYTVYLRQMGTFEIWRHYGGTPRNGLIVVVVLAFMAGRVFGQLDLPPLAAVALQ